MNVRQRRKLFAGAGLVSMLMGAFMMLMPSGAGAETEVTSGSSGNEDCDSLADGALMSKYEGNFTADGETEYTAAGDFSVTFTVSAIEGGGLRFDFFDSGELVSVVFVKQASGKQGLSETFTIDPPAKSGSVDYTKDSGFSHITFCSGELETTTTSSSTTSSSTTSSSTTTSTTTTQPTTTTTAAPTTTTAAPTTTIAVSPTVVTAAPTTAPAIAPTTTAAPATTQASVLGAVVTRQLPRTGDESLDLAAVGAALVLLGAGMVVVSNRRLRES